MREIPLTQGQVALVDDADFKELSKHKWCAVWNPHICSFYAVRGIRLPSGKWTSERMHRRLLCLVRGDSRQGDHVDHNTLDNRRVNIRIVSLRENQHNRRAKGFFWNKSARKFEAQIEAEGVKKYLGLHDTPAEARAAYLAAKPIYHPTAPLSARIIHAIAIVLVVL